jgi:hypothetical protein
LPVELQLQTAVPPPSPTSAAVVIPPQNQRCGFC